jgi:hypothetical protein
MPSYSWAVKVKIVFGNSLGFQPQIENLGWKGCIPAADSKNNITGNNVSLPVFTNVVKITKSYDT